MALVRIQMTPTLSVGGAYTPGAYVGRSNPPQSAAAVSVPGSGFILESATLLDKTAAPAVFDLFIFRANAFVAPTDKQPWIISDADMLNCMAVVRFADWYTTPATNSICHVPSVGSVIVCATNGFSYGLVCRGAGTWVTGDLVLTLATSHD